MEGRKVNYDDNIPTNDNKNQHVGKVSGGSDNVEFTFAQLMTAHKKHGGQNKSNNFKEAKKANIRRNEKFERGVQKEYAAKVAE